MMTLYLTFEALEAGKISLDQSVRVSHHAQNQAPSKLGLVDGQMVPMRDLILGLITRSANDAAVVVAEALAGSERAFAERMTEQAQRARHDQHDLSQRLRPAQPGPAHHGARPRQAGAGALSRFPEGIRLFRHRGVHLQGLDLRQSQPI